MINTVTVPWSAARRDPEGAHIGFDLGGPARIGTLVIRAIDATAAGATPTQSWDFTSATTDYRAFRGINVKPVLNGSFVFEVDATDDRGCSASQRSSHPVSVVVGGGG